MYNFSRLIFLGLIVNSLLIPCFALELEPRQWSHLPLGTNFAGVGYAYTKADISVDPVVLLEDVELELQILAGKYIRTFELFDKSARIVPYTSLPERRMDRVAEWLTRFSFKKWLV